MVSLTDSLTTSLLRFNIQDKDIRRALPLHFSRERQLTEERLLLSQGDHYVLAYLR